jgi:hypothetical protein
MLQYRTKKYIIINIPKIKISYKRTDSESERKSATMTTGLDQKLNKILQPQPPKPIPPPTRLRISSFLKLFTFVHSLMGQGNMLNVDNPL